MNDELLSSGSTGIVSAEDTDLAEVDVDLSVDDYNPEIELPGKSDSDYLERTDDQSDLGPVSSPTQGGTLAPLSYWDQTTKRTFSSLPARVKKVWLSSSHKDAVRYERALAKLDTDYAPLAEIGEILAPVASSVIPKFGSVANYVKALIIEDSIVGTDPAVHIARIMRDMGVKRQDIDLAVTRLPEVEQQLRTVIPLQARAEQAEKRADFLARQQQLEDERALQYFYSQTDKRGNPLYPDFEGLRGYIYELVIGMEQDAINKGTQLTPDQIDLDALYKKAKAVRDVLAYDPSKQGGIGLNKNAMGEMPEGFPSNNTPRGQRFVGPFDASKIDLEDNRVYRQMAAEAEGFEDPSEVSYGDMGGSEE
jgi:hypothetical protein